jgi:hypothetical protein
MQVVALSQASYRCEPPRSFQDDRTERMRKCRLVALVSATAATPANCLLFVQPFTPVMLKASCGLTRARGLHLVEGVAPHQPPCRCNISGSFQDDRRGIKSKRIPHAAAGCLLFVQPFTPVMLKASCGLARARGLHLVQGLAPPRPPC